MKIALVVGLVIVAMVGIVILIGYLLPVDHVASRSETYKTSAAGLWSVILDYEKYPDWRPDVKSVDPTASKNGMPSWTENGSNGRIAYEVVEMVPNQTLVTQIIGKGLPFGGKWIFRLTPTAEGTNLLVTEEGEVYNPIFRFVSRFVVGHTTTIDLYFKALRKRVENQ